METDTPVAAENGQAKGSRLIGRVLPPAVRLWIRSQLDHVEALSFDLRGSDRQILSGYVPGVAVTASQAVYRGLHLSEVQVMATDIQINLGQVLRGKALRLKQRFPIQGSAVIRAADLNASLATPLFRDAVLGFLQQISLSSQSGESPLEGGLTFAPEAFEITAEHISLSFYQEGVEYPLILKTAITVRDGRVLVLKEVRISSAPADRLMGETALGDREIDLGPEVSLEDVRFTPGQLDIAGTVQVVP